MQKQAIAMMAVVGCAATMLTGCGIPKEKHQAVVDDLNAKIAEIETLKGNAADLDSKLDAERDKVRKAGIEAENEADRLAKSKAAVAEALSELANEESKVGKLEGDLSAEKAKVVSAQQNADEVATDLADLQAAYKVLQARWKQFEDNLNALDDTVGPGKASAPTPAVAPAPVGEGEGKSTLDLLNEMGAQ